MLIRTLLDPVKESTRVLSASSPAGQDAPMCVKGPVGGLAWDGPGLSTGLTGLSRNYRPVILITIFCS